MDAFLRWPVKRTKLAYFSVLIDDFLQILVEISIPYVKCQGNSFKFHWPRHWVHSRLQLGCAAAEKTLERELAETNFFYRFTNGKGDISSQIGAKDMRAWTLRDVLHAGGLPPMEDDNAKDDFFSPPPIKEPSLVGKRSIFQYQCEGKGLPVSLAIDVRRALLRAIGNSLANGVLQWRAPITIGTSMSLSLRN